MDMPTAKKTGRGRRKKTNTKLTEAEWEILKVVWQEEPCAAGTVQEALAQRKDWAYGTVKSTMDRMVEKGFLKITRMRNLQLFHSCITQVEAKRGELRKMLSRAFDGALTPMVQFLIEHEGLSKEEASGLRKLVRRIEKDKE